MTLPEVVSSRAGYDIVRVQTQRMENRSVHCGYKIEHFVILYHGEPVGALTNEHSKGNWRIIKQDGNQMCPWGAFEVVDFQKVLNTVFNTPVIEFLDKRVFIKVTTEMGFVRYATKDYGQWSTQNAPEPLKREDIVDLKKIMNDLESCHTHPYGDIVKKIEVIPYR